MFTKKQIEEIASKLAERAVKDSQFEEVIYPFTGTEEVPVLELPILQDSANKRMPFSDFVNLVTGNDENMLMLSLTITCDVPEAEVKVNGTTISFNHGTYTAAFHYGSVIIITATAEGYDDFYESVTLTENTEVDIVMNDSSGNISLLPKLGYYTLVLGDNTRINLYSKEQIDDLLHPQVTTHTVKVTNTQGALITIGVNGAQGTPVGSGSINTYDTGTQIRIIVSLTGFNTYDSGVFALNSDYDEVITLSASS